MARCDVEIFASLPKSWKDAKTSGSQHYFTGKPCIRDHIDRRLTSTGHCETCSRERSVANYHASPEKMRQRSAAYKTNNKEKVAETFRVWAKKNKDKLREKKKERGAADALSYYYRNREKVLKKKTKDREAHPEKYASFRKMHSHKIAVFTAKRRAGKLRATPKWFGEFDRLVMSEAYELAKLRSEATGVKWEVDHKIPLQAKWASGFHVSGNVQVIPKRLNSLKSARRVFVEDFEWVKSC